MPSRVLQYHSYLKGGVKGVTEWCEEHGSEQAVKRAARDRAGGVTDRVKRGESGVKSCEDTCGEDCDARRSGRAV